MNDSKISKVLKYTVYFLGGFLSSLPYIGGSFSPFTASFAASCDEFYSVSAAAGSILSIFLFHSGLTSFRYFAITVTSTATLHIALKAFLMKREKLLRILCPTICSLTVNFIFLVSQGRSFDLVVSVICETALCGVSVPVFMETINQIRNRKFLIKTDEREKDFVCFILTTTFAAAHIRCLGVAGQAVSFFIFFFSILFFSEIKGFFGGVMTGICCSLVYGMGGEIDFTCVMLSLCGCLCAFFEMKPKILKSLIVVACGTAGFLFGEYTEMLPVLPASVAAGIAYFVIPLERLELTKKIADESYENAEKENRKSNEIASAVESLSDCVNAVRKTLQPLITPELKTELIKTKEKVCSQCEICDSCINEIKNSDNPCFAKIAKSFATGEPDFSLFPEKFSETCCHSEMILDEMKKAYFIHCTNVNAGNKINRFQTLAGNQFKTFGGIIGQACEAATGTAVKESRYDSACATSAEEFGVKIKDARLCTDKAGRDYFDISFLKPENNFNVTALTEKLNTDTGYQLDFPTLVQSGNVYDLVFKQKEKLCFNIAAAVKPSEGKNVCGDYYRCFKDSFSRQVVLLSDGMGTGSRAAVDSAFTCETFSTLIKSGLDEKTAAAAVNCAMMMKSTDESFSTVDFLRLDPVLKTAQVFKCGAAPTFILKKRKISVIETESTPIGILDNVNMSHSSFEIDAGDIIILASDGVSGDKFNWIFGELKSWNNLNASALAKHILQCAADRKIGKRADDMTVIAVCIAENK